MKQAQAFDETLVPVLKYMGGEIMSFPFWGGGEYITPTDHSDLRTKSWTYTYSLLFFQQLSKLLIYPAQSRKIFFLFCNKLT